MAPTKEDYEELQNKTPFAEIFTDPSSEGFKNSLKAFALLSDPTRVPAVVVRPRSTLDVQEFVKFATKHNLPFAPKCGGHSVAQPSIIRDGMTIDLSLMRSVYVDPAAKVAIADGGCYIGDIDRETSLYNLAVPLGHIVNTGMGLVLNGGVGIATRLLGSSSSHIIGVTMVKADGSVVNVDEESDPELLWAIKGAGRKACVKFLRDVGSKEPGFSTPVVSEAKPDGTRIVVLMICYLGPKSHEERHKFLQFFRDMDPIMDTVGKMTYGETQFSLLPMVKQMPPHYEYWAHGMLGPGQATDACIDTYAHDMIAATPANKYPVTLFVWDTYGGAMSKEDGPTPWANGGKEYAWVALLGYLDPSLHEEVRTFAHTLRDKLAPFSSVEAYGNFGTCSAEPDDKLAVRVGGKANLDRLKAVKNRVDPDNVIRYHPLAGL